MMHDLLIVSYCSILVCLDATFRPKVRHQLALQRERRKLPSQNHKPPIQKVFGASPNPFPPSFRCVELEMCT